MRIRQSFLLSSIFLLMSTASVLAQNKTAKPVSPNASPEATALLQLLYSLSGKYTLTGQHNFPMARDRNSKFAASYTGKTPVIWSIDFGFAKKGDKDSYLERAANVEEAKRQNKMGAIVTMCWHAVPPTASEPVTFQPVAGADPNALASVQGRLTDQQYKDILTPGTELNKKWMAQVDTIAFYLKQLQKAHVPVLWRPYHEMNGNWFWWGNRTGQYSTQALYRQIFDRLVNYHKLDNLIWVWSVDRPTRAGMEFSNFYPGDNYLDILALDVYGSDFKQDYYDQLLVLSQGKPITLAEVGTPPTPEILEKQPKWSYWVIWAGMTHGTPKKQFEALANDPQVLGLHDAAYINAVNPFRAKIGELLLPLNQPADFSGEWVLNESKSNLGVQGAGNLPHKLKIDQKDTEIYVQRYFIEEWRDDRVSEDKMTLTGKETKSDFYGSPRGIIAGLSANLDTLNTTTIVILNRGGQTTRMTTTEIWALQNHGNELSIAQSSISPQGSRKIMMVFDRE